MEHLDSAELSAAAFKFRDVLILVVRDSKTRSYAIVAVQLCPSLTSAYFGVIRHCSIWGTDSTQDILVLIGGLALALHQ